MIYEDPVTETRKEGPAKLVRKNTDLGTGPEYRLESWQVKFPGEHRTVTRTIKEIKNPALDTPSRVIQTQQSNI